MSEWICEEFPILREDGAIVGVGLNRLSELVRCKDCRWYAAPISWCDNCRLPREQTFFCADGRRKFGEVE